MCWLAEYLASNADATRVRQNPPGPDDLGWFWIDPDQDSPPISISRREPPPGEGLVYFSADSVAEVAQGAQKTLVEHPVKTVAPVVLVVYGALGLDGLGHYALALCSEHTWTMNFTIWSEVASGLALSLKPRP